jgi:hypothetical protein
LKIEYLIKPLPEMEIRMVKLEKIKDNFHRVFVNDFCFWFSYETIVAYRSPNGQIVCSANKWTVTTEKHLKEIQPDQSLRIKPSKFEEIVETLEINFN